MSFLASPPVEELSHKPVGSSPAVAAPASALRVPEIDGLRGVAILLVLFVHYYVQQFADGFRAFSPDLFEFCLSASSGVDLFFVISGFLIGGILLDRVRSGGALKAFYLRRAWRIWPLYYLIIAVAFLSSLGGYDAGVRVPWTAYLLFLQNISLSFGLLSVPMLAPLWSLAIEEHFYLLAPLAVRWLQPRNLVILAVTLIALSPALRIAVLSTNYRYRMPFAFNFTFCRLDAIGFGLIGAVRWRKPDFQELLVRHRAWLRAVVCLLGLGAIVAAIPAIARLSYVISPLRITLNTAFFLALVFLSISDGNSWLARCLRTAPMRFVGLRCYFIYVFHMAILSIAETTVSYPHLATIAALLLCLIYAEISWRYLERPLIQHSHLWAYDRELRFSPPS